MLSQAGISACTRGVAVLDTPPPCAHDESMARDGAQRVVGWMRGEAVRIILTSVFVEDQEKARQFYTEKLGFVVKSDYPVGRFRWLTLVSPEGHDDVELLLEPNDNHVAKVYQRGIYEQGIAAATFGVDDVRREYERLKGRGVHFTMEPTVMGDATIAVLDDTCGNLIQIAGPA